MNIAVLEPKNRDNLATILRSGQNFGVKAVFVIGGFIQEQYKGNVHKFSHQMNTQSALCEVALLYFESLGEFLQHLPAQTTLVLVEMVQGAYPLKQFEHPPNATYLFGRETKGITNANLELIRAHFETLQSEIPKPYRQGCRKTAHLVEVFVDVPDSLNLGVCASIVMYDRHAKHQRQDKRSKN
jgi:tRNA(Leu) C34 or U34 (ribose-2'-O)-methylase TrmL